VKVEDFIAEAKSLRLGGKFRHTIEIGRGGCGFKKEEMERRRSRPCADEGVVLDRGAKLARRQQKNAQPKPERPLDRTRDPAAKSRLGLDGRRKYEVSTLDVSPKIHATKRFEQVGQSRHRHLVLAANVDPAQ